MSKLALESFVAWKAAPNGDLKFFPEPSAVSQQGKTTTITLGNVPLPSKIPAPERGLTVLYGFRDALDEMKAQFEHARRNGMNILKVSFHLDVDDIVMGTTNPESIASTKFLNLRRLSKDLQQVILDGVNELSARDGKKAVLYDRILQAGERPDLICKVIRSEKVFSHITSVVYMVPDGTPRGRQVATIFTTDVTDFATRGDAPFQVKLPKLG